MLSLQLFLFGVPRIERDGETIFVNRRKAIALLAYLAVTAHLHSRDALATLFWPEHDQSGGRANLRRDLSRLKQVLGDEVLFIDRAQVGVNPEAALWLDVAAFQSAVATAQQHGHPPHTLCSECYAALTEAVALYSDDFMAGFTLPDSPEFDEWQFFEAESLRNSLATALQQLIHWHARQQEYDQGIEYGRRWLALDPLRESAQRQLMQLYAWSGQQAAALRQYQECVRLLGEELGVEPEEETKALYEAIKARRLEMPAGEQGSRGAGEMVAQDHLLSPRERYVQQELLMVSGQGEVYRGLDRVTNQPVVIKRLRPDLVGRRPDLVTRLVREGEALSQLNHPNIVQMLATLEKDDEHAIVMEYVAGGSLRQLLEESPSLALAQALDIALELADALSRAHHLGIIHRDLKPDNVLLAADGTPRLTDFGMARLGGDEARLTQTGSFIGSPAYMSPEALHGEELDVRSDVWSFGVLLYEMLAGRRPFAGTHITSVLVSILNDPVPELQQFRPDVPPPLANLLQRMLVKDRAQRIASMRQVAAELEAIRAGWSEGRTPPPTSLWTPSPIPSVAPAAGHKLEQVIRFCHSADGVRLAYAVVGEGPPLIKAANWLNHLEYDWQSPVWHHWLQGLAQHHRLIRYDERGCGLSDWDVADISFEAWVSDLEAVVDAAGVDRFPLVGISHGGPVAIAYAVRYPERVSHLILYGAFTRGIYRRRFTEQQQKEAKMINDMIEIGWGRENPAYRQVFTSNFMPDGTAEHYRSFNELQRVSSSPENAVRIIDAFRAIDVSDLTASVSMPTLVIHARNDASVPFEEGRRLASLIAGAQFVPLESRNHILMESEPAWQQFLAEIYHFLGMEAANAGQQGAQVRHAVPSPPLSPAVERGGAEQASIFHNLPLPPTPFIGREPELAEVRRLLLDEADCRLLTLLGPGGIGKTRLALAAAAGVRDAFAHGVYFVPLASLNSAEHIVSALAESLNFNFQGVNDPEVQLLNYLLPKQMLLMLDNFEHLLDGRDLVDKILKAAPAVKLMVTSRERLQLSEESIYTLGGMAYLDWSSPTATPTEPDVIAYDAARLFLQQARLVRPDFQLQVEEYRHVAHICRLVQGMPLALVLAAGWLDMLSLSEIAGEIAQSLDFLETELRDVPERQRSMRAVFETSWKRLTPEGQQALAALSVFRGGFTRAAAQAITGAGLHTLRKLLNKSLISLGKEGRYEIHELLRQFAAEQLQTDSHNREQAQNQHAAYYTAFLHQRTEELKRAGQKEAIAEITADLDNIRAAWRWAISHGDIQALEKAAESFYYFSDIQGAFHEGDSAFAQAVAALGTTEESLLGDPDRDPAVAGRQESLVGFLLVLQGWMRSERGRFVEAQSLIEQGLALIRQAGERSDTMPVRDQRYREAFALMHLGWVLYEQEKSSEAKQRAQLALSLFSEVGDRWGELLCHLLLATIIEQDGDLVRAEQYAQACLAICREIGERREQAFALMVIGRNALAWGNYVEAKDHSQQAVQISQELNDATSKVKALRDLGRLAIVQGEYRRAAATLQECLAILNEVGSTWLIDSVQNYLGSALRLQRDFEGAGRCYQDSLAVAQTLAHQTRIAACLSNWGCLAYDQGDYSQAKKYQQEALAIWQEVGNEPETASSLRHLGTIATAEGEHKWPQARQYFSQALPLALKHRLAPLALDVFVEVAEVVAQVGEAARAVELLALAEDHPASTHETREKARQRLSQLSAAMPALDVQTARARGRALDWREAAGSLITQLAYTGQELRSTAALEPQVGQNLPAQTTPFIGREEELADIVNKLTEPDTRLLTLIGPGGIGKTRLALAAAAQVISAFSDGAYFVPLAPLESAGYIASALADSLDYQLRGSREPKEQLLDYLRQRRLLLVLDNFEHLLEGAEVVAEILEMAPGVKVLATSRERLNLSGEMVYALGGMSYPDWQRALDTDATAYSAVQLLLQRARLVRPDLKPERQNLVHAARICQLVEGMPLALVLAAGWLEILTLEEIAEEIVQSLDFLETEMRDVPERQRSVRAVFDSSWKRLSPEEQQAFMRLTVFRGGFTRQAAQTVAGVGLRTLRSLVNKSLIIAGREDRYEIHEVLRQYGEEELIAEGEAEPTQDQYFRFYLALAEEAEPHLAGETATIWLARLEAEHDNLRAALAWSLSGKGTVDAIDGLRLAQRLQQFWDFGVYYREALTWLTRLLARVEAATPEATAERAGALFDARTFAALLGDVKGARAYGEEAMALFQQLEDKPRLARTLATLAALDVQQDDYTAARARLEEALAVAQASGDRPARRSALATWGTLAWQQGDLVTAQAYLEEALALARELGHKDNIKVILYYLGNVVFHRGDLARARTLHEEGLVIAQEVGDLTNIAWSQIALGDLALIQGDVAEARAFYDGNLVLLEELGNQKGLAMALLSAGKMAVHGGDFAAANAYLAKCLRRYQALGSKLGIAEVLEAFAYLAVAEAEEHASLKKHERLQWSAQLLAVAESVRTAIGTPLPPVFQPFHEHHVAAVRTGLGEAEFAAAWQRGQALDLDELLRDFARFAVK